LHAFARVKDDTQNAMPDAVRSREVVTTDAHIGRYRIVRPLEIDATSEMFLAVTEGAFGFERTVIIKRLMPHANADRSRAQSFGYEASAYARLTHPAIVRLYDFFTVDEMPAMVLEHVEGVSLRKLTEELSARGEKLPVNVALYIGARICAALSAAHTARSPVTHKISPVIHRDVNPASVLIAFTGEVKLSNFGFAKLEGTAATTNLDLPKGTVGYMAPEQLLGEPVTPRTDVYAVALVVRELLTGEATFVLGSELYVDFLQTMARPRLSPMAEVCPLLPPAVAAALDGALSASGESRCTALELQRALSAHRGDGQAALSVLFARLGLVPEGETDPIDLDPEPSSSATVPAILRLEARARRARLAAITFAAFALLFAVLAMRPRMRAAQGSTAMTPAPTPQQVAMGRATATPPVPTSPERPPREPETSVVAPSPTTGELRTAASSPPHRVFVDGRVAGETGSTFTMDCGAHVVRIGAAGKAQSVTVPCGGNAEVGGR
jgi:serine/threonine protein kinase